jgi:Transposase IS66 family
MALEPEHRIDALFAVERHLNGKTALERLAARKLHSAPLVADLETWMRGQRAKLLGRTQCRRVGHARHRFGPEIMVVL